MSQNRGNVMAMAASIKNIPFHAFNVHDNCGEWCGYLRNKENYEHRTVRGGLKNGILFEELKTVFQKLSDNAEAFVCCGSTQANESLNNIISKKAPKAVPYDCSESYDYRVASSIAQKNEGEKYLQDALLKWNLSPGSHLSKHIEQVTKSAKMRSEKAKTPAFKLHRHTLKKNRAQLRNLRETMEGQTYESNIGLFKAPSAITTDTSTTSSELEDRIKNQAQHSIAIVFFDIETSGFSMTDDILQVAMKYNNTVFNKYANSTKRINAKASVIHGLSNEGSDLYFRGVRVESSPIRLLLNDLLAFLNAINKPCILVAHNCNFDSSRLLLKIKEASLIEEFSKIVIGFTDSLSLFRKQFPDRKVKGAFKLTTLAGQLMNLSIKDAHNAICDVILLEKLVRKFISYDDLVQNTKSVISLTESMDKEKNCQIYLKSLNPLVEVVSKAMLKRMAYSAISYESILCEYQKSEKHVIDLLEQRVKGKAQVIKSKKVLNTILSYLSKR
ncbi:uncharacterized protein LOC108630062 [Ceratina calcarata]|uniref:Uncharacterized protein LOC108630062 n=1 Tax=Ceratina calcarata TaxID=156304 RepID=A0AAJ7JBC8_9HYME|nr:uncharacterized protein LOC108630062 [Ceratina calcarata]